MNHRASATLSSPRGAGTAGRVGLEPLAQSIVLPRVVLPLQLPDTELAVGRRELDEDAVGPLAGAAGDVFHVVGCDCSNVVLRLSRDGWAESAGRIGYPF